MKKIILVLVHFIIPIVGFGNQISCVDLLFSTPLKMDGDLSIKARSYKVDWGHYYDQRSIFEFSYRNTTLKWGTKVNLIYGFHSQNPYNPNQNWKSRNIIELNSVSDFTWGTALQITTADRFDQFDQIQFVMEIVHPDGHKTYENGKIEPMGFLTAQIPYWSTDNGTLQNIEVGAVNSSGHLSAETPSTLGVTSAQILEFHRAIDNDNVPSVLAMLHLGKDLINSFHPDDGYTPLIRASRLGNSLMVQTLMRAGADPLLPEAKSMNALAAHKGAFQGHLNVLNSIFLYSDAATIRRILETQGPKNGKTVLMDAMWIDRPGLPIQYQIPDDKIPFYAEIALFLIMKSKEVGADLGLRNQAQESALDIAKINAKKYPIFEQVVRSLE